MDLTLRCRAYPDEEIASVAWEHIDILRQIRNQALRHYYRSPHDDRPTEYDQHAKLSEWKRRWPVFKKPSAHAVQQSVSQIHKDHETQKGRRESGYKTGRLKWQGHGEFRSVSYNQPSRYDVDHNTGEDGWLRLRLEKIGWIQVRAHRGVPETDDIKRVVLKKERTGEWFVTFVVEADEPEKPDLSNLTADECVGIDLGISSYIHTSDDLAVDCLDLTDSYDCHARAQRSLDRKVHGSANWEKQRQKVARAKRHIKRKVLDFQHKLSTWLVTEYDFIAVEDLDVKPMLETIQSAKNKQDAAWSRFIRLLEYKAKLHGVHVISVEPRNTTKACNQCGVKTSKPLWVREHSCPACGHEEDRDLNAAKNVLDKALAESGVPFVRTTNSLHVGPGRSESTPVQTALPTFTDGGSGVRRHSHRVDAKRVVEAGSPDP